MPHRTKCGAAVAQCIAFCPWVRSTWRRPRDVFHGRSNTSRRAANSKVRFSKVTDMRAGEDAIGNPRT